MVIATLYQIIFVHATEEADPAIVLQFCNSVIQVTLSVTCSTLVGIIIDLQHTYICVVTGAKTCFPIGL